VGISGGAGTVCAFCGVLFVNTIVARPREAFMGLTLMLSGVPVYFWMRRR